MNVKAIPFSELHDICADPYTTVMIIAQRAKQIIDQRVIPFDENEDVEDSIQFEEIEVEIDEKEKPMVVALEEHLNGDLKWRRQIEDDINQDDS